MRFSHLVAATAALLLSGLASAADAAEVKQNIEVAAKPATVWKKIGLFCSIKDWHPALANCEVSKVGKDTFRLLTLKDGGKIKEKLTDEGRNTYSYAITESPLPVANYSATLSVKAGADDARSDITWTAKFDPKDKPEAEAKGIIEGIFKGGLENIKTLINADNEAAAKAKAERQAKIDALKVAALAKVAQAKAVVAEKSKQLADASRAAYEKAKAEVAALQTPEAKAERQSKIDAAKAAAAEKYAKAKLVLAEKAQQAADAAKAAYEKAKAALDAASSKTATPAPAPADAKK